MRRLRGPAVSEQKVQPSLDCSLAPVPAAPPDSEAAFSFHPLAFLLSISICLLAGSSHSQEKADQRPSVLLIVMDTVRADHLGSYGYPRNTSPSLDALASDAVRFTHAFTVMPHTLPAHLSLFTSRYPRELGILMNGQVYDGEASLLAEVLQENGYRTGAFVSGFPVHSKFGLGHGFDTYKNSDGWKTDGKIAYEAFASWLEEPSEAPFFAWVHLYDAHIPYAPPTSASSHFEVDDVLREWVRKKQITINPEWGPVIDQTVIRKQSIKKDTEPFLQNLNQYDSEIRYADSIAGKLLDLLRDKGVYESTLIIVLSDHGEGLGEHDYYFHGLYLFEEQLHIPLIIRMPGAEQSGTVINEIVSVLDITPTILDALAITDDEERRGFSLIPILHGGEEKWLDNRRVYSESRKYSSTSPKVPAHLSKFRRHGLRDNRWKFVLSTGGDMELYDLLADPEELINLASRKKKVAAKLKAALDGWLELIPEGEDADSKPLSKEDREKLRSLGYAD